jgi:hypothetical protein
VYARCPGDFLVLARDILRGSDPLAGKEVAL